MWPTPQDWASALYIIAPIYCTNGAPVIFGGGRPIDLGRKLSDGERVFGDNKTVRGFVSGLAAGGIVATLEALLASNRLFQIGILASLGALFGDLAGAFLKRRLRIKPGGALIVVDQLDFVLGAAIFVGFVSQLSLATLLILILLTPPIHLLTNLGAYALGLKSTYW